MTFLTVLGVLVIIFCTFSAVAKPSQALTYIVVAVVVTVGIALLPRTEIGPSYDSSDPDFYEQAREDCLERQEHTDKYLHC